MVWFEKNECGFEVMRRFFGGELFVVEGML